MAVAKASGYDHCISRGGWGGGWLADVRAVGAFAGPRFMSQRVPGSRFYVP